MPFGAAAGHGVYPSVSTTVTAGLGRSAAAAPMPAPMSVPPPPISSTWRAELTRCAGATAVSRRGSTDQISTTLGVGPLGGSLATGLPA